jgi:hypothetical protein
MRIWNYRTSHGVIAVFMALVLVSVPLMAQTTPSDGGYAAGKLDGDRDGRGSAWWLVGGCFLSCIGILIAYLIKPSPPAANLIGKSSDYVMGYTQAYKSKAAGGNDLWAGIGCLLNGISGCVSYAIWGGLILTYLQSLLGSAQ